MVSWRGRWYLVGHDRDRDDVRSFRLSRIVAPVTPVGPAGAVAPPPDVDLMALIKRNFDPGPVIDTARLWVAAGRAHGLRRLARVTGPREHGGRAGDELAMDVRSAGMVARWIAGHGPDVVVLAPAGARGGGPAQPGGRRRRARAAARRLLPAGAVAVDAR